LVPTEELRPKRLFADFDGNPKGLNHKGHKGS
jgi:hypothetical protein